MQWHQDDPVDDWERNRNDVIYSYQNNRNPFIDHPEYVDLIWNTVSVVNTTFNQLSNLNIYPNPASDYVKIDNPDNNNITLFTATGIAIEQVNNDYIDLTHILPGLYFVGIKNLSGYYISSKKIFVK